MRILVTNDDGIHCEYLVKLAQLAKDFGEVWVIAPSKECSAMSHRVTVNHELILKKEPDFPVEGVHAYSLNGTPADCVKVGVSCVVPEKTDLVFSGMNVGYNLSRDVVYSGTFGAAAEGAMRGVTSIAYSIVKGEGFEVPETYFREITEILLKKKLGPDEVWNVNFPGGKAEDIKGILFDRTLAPLEYHFKRYEKEEIDENQTLIKPVFQHAKTGPEGSDIKAVTDGYIAISRVKNMVP